MANFAGAAPLGGEEPAEYDRYNRYMLPEYTLPHPLHPGASGHRILDPGPTLVPWTRVTTLAGTMSSEKQIDDWKSRLVVKGIGIRPDLYALAAATPIDDKGKLTDVANQAADAAGAKARANLGTAMHSFTEFVDAGEDIFIPKPWEADVMAYRDKLDELGIELIPGLAELRGINPRWADGGAAGAAGKFDRIVMFEGRPIIGDLKTGQDPLKYGANKIAIQLWLYATAWALYDGEKYHNLPKGLDTDEALVFHVRPGSGECEVHRIPLEGCERAVELSLEVREWRRKNVKSQLVELEQAPSPAKVAAKATKVANKARTKVQAAVDALPPFTPDDSDGIGTEGEDNVPAVIMDGTGKKPLQPLSLPGQPGCSICGRIGHRRGSPKCLGDDDPGAGTPVVKTKAAGPAVLPPHPVEEPMTAEEDEFPALAEGPREDPFDDEDEPEGVDWCARVDACKTKDDLKAVRAEAKAKGEWTNELLTRALEVLEKVGK